MGLVSQTVKNLIAGISQQPQVLRHPDQAEYQENCFSTEVGGLQKRPPTLHIAKLDDVLEPGINPLVHIINRDSSEQYTAIFTGTGVAVWDKSGLRKTVNYTGDAQDYLDTANPRVDLRAVTVADHTFVVNRKTVAEMTTDTTPDVWATQGALINVKSGQYGRTYSIILNGSQQAAFSTPDGSVASHSTQIDTNYIANQLKNGLVANGWSVAQGEGWLYITKDGTTINTVDTKDGYNNQSMFGILHTVQKFTNLPFYGPDGFICKVQGEPGSSADDYYVKFIESEKIWKECPKPGLLNTFDPYTMPHILVREADGSFTFKEATWETRNTGDDDSIPVPSFVGQTINDIFFFRNRLGFLAGENAILSKSGEFFTFWMSSALDVLDTDMIDLAASHDSVCILYHALSFNEDLLLWSGQTQFVLKADGVLSPKNARIDKITDFECKTEVRPTAAGKNIYFPSERALYTSIKEFYCVQDVSNIKNAQDVSSHVPNFINNGVHKIMSSTIENVLLSMTTGAPNTLFVYKYLFIQEQRAQSSWSHWTFGEDVEILGGGFMESTLYLVLKRGDGLFLEKMIFTYNTKDFDEEPYRVLLDRKAYSGAVPDGSYDVTKDSTTLDLEACYASPLTSDKYGVVAPDGFYQEFEAADIVNGLVSVRGDWTGQRFVVGRIYNSKYTFSEVMLKTADGNGGTKSDTDGRLQVLNFWVSYEATGYLRFTVALKDGREFYYELTGRQLGATTNVLGSMPSASGTFKFPVKTVSTNCWISIENPYPTASAVIGAGWDGNYIRRSSRV